MSNCTCNNSVFWDGIRYCPDCDTHTTAPTQDELNRKIQVVPPAEQDYHEQTLLEKMEAEDE